jgi:hypothetical protein
MMSSPSNSSRPEVGSISRVRQRTSVDFPEPDSPITTNISPGATSKVTSRTAAVHPVRSSSSRLLNAHSSGLAGTASAWGPKTFQRSRTAITGSRAPVVALSAVARTVPVALDSGIWFTRLVGVRRPTAAPVHRMSGEGEVKRRCDHRIRRGDPRHHNSGHQNDLPASVALLQQLERGADVNLT